MSQQSLFIADGAGTDNVAAVLNTIPVGTENALAVRVIGTFGGTSSSFTSSFPASGTAAGFSDGYNMQGARVFNADTGVGTEYVLGTNLRFAASGGSVEAGTVTSPLRTDPTGTTIQPVQIPDSANASTALGALNAVATLTLSGRNTVGFHLDTGTLTGTIVPEASIDGGSTYFTIKWIDNTTGIITSSDSVTNPNGVLNKTFILPAGVSQVRARISAYTSGTANGRNRASDVLSGIIPSIISDGTNIVAVVSNALKVDNSAVIQPIKSASSSTSSISNISSLTTNQTLLASNSSRLGAMVYNNSNKSLYLKLGATATSTSFTAKLAPSGYYEVPFGYIGQIDGFWDNVNGAALVTELT